MIIKPVILGKLGSSYGVKGWIKITSYSSPLDNIFNYSPWFIKINEKWQEIEVEQCRKQGNTLVAKLHGVETKEQVSELTHCEIAIDAEQLEKLPTDEFYWRDLIGCKVINKENYNFGVVNKILETGSNDVLQVKANPNDAFGKTERLIPFVSEGFIVNVDLDKKEILVNWDPDF